MKGNWREAAYEERGLLGLTAALLAAILLLNPVGFQGGGMDDWQYLNAARCWIEYGPCLPEDHWQSRWPVIAPLLASLGLLGESRWSAGLPSLLFGLTILTMLWGLFVRTGHARIGSMVTLFVVITPAFTTRLLQPNVEYPELLMLLACAHSMLSYRNSAKRHWAFAAGIFFALSVQARETAAVALPILLLFAWKWARSDIRALIAAAFGTAIPTAVELLIFLVETGNPFYRRTLSIDHTQILSTELKSQPDPNAPPFFNTTYIANWRHQPGIAIHWSVDGLINLVFNAVGGLSLLFNLLLWPVTAGKVSEKESRLIKFAVLAMAYWSFVIVYALAIDPNPRMLLVPILGSQVILAIQLGVLERLGWRLARFMILTAMTVSGLAVILTVAGNHHAEDELEHLLIKFDGQIESDINTRKQLELISGRETLTTVFDDRPLLLVQLGEQCAPWANEKFGEDLSLVRSIDMNPLRSLYQTDAGFFCLFRYRQPIEPKDFLVARFPMLPDEIQKQMGSDARQNFER
ncbi:ArnT family glycosyltransferase [Sphingomicrobium clamense]|uniref:Glycosyltransferase family 39 protein n=1 Tax=Sphingomicrobium clamense TaxID=2851013 RepID=A0ABS6V7B5_9SPHN|nr:glycosyltransferase family 39 protein [Sphingomicrobium sp. B8]MBW0145461.1 glycosyltransferase family 39 protein [Sphingomicrobium sp. B8]